MNTRKVFEKNRDNKKIQVLPIFSISETKFIYLFILPERYNMPIFTL